MTDSKRLNYQHLYYFWSVARAGSITNACIKLGVSQPTISSQLSVFEDNIGEKLFQRDGRKLKLTDKGHLIYNYADEIFAIGNALIDTLNHVIYEKKYKISIGVDSNISSLLISNILEPVLSTLKNSWINIQRGNQSSLISQLCNHSIEYILSENPITLDSYFRTYCNYNASLKLAAFATNDFIESDNHNLIDTIRHSPLILPSRDTGFRLSLDKWFQEQNIAPRIIAEIDDETVRLILAKNGLGLIFAPGQFSSQICDQYDLNSLGELVDVQFNLYVISASKKINNNIMKEIIVNSKRKFA